MPDKLGIVCVCVCVCLCVCVFSGMGVGTMSNWSAPRLYAGWALMRKRYIYEGVVCKVIQYRWVN